MQKNNSMTLLAVACLLSSAAGCSSADKADKNTSQQAAALETAPVSNAPVLDTPVATAPSDEPAQATTAADKISLECLVDASLEKPKEFFLVRKVVDGTSNITKAFDQLETHVSKEFCISQKNYAPTLANAVREKNASFQKDLSDEFVCLKDAAEENPNYVYLVRTTRDETRGIVTSILAMNAFEKLEHCQYWIKN